MSTDTIDAGIETMADLLEQLGGVPLERIRFHPPPGTATERDVLDAEQRDNRLCELVDGVLVEKVMGFREAILAGALVRLLANYVVPRNLGHVAGADGMLRLFPGLVRIPDVAFASWDCFPEGRLPEEPIPELAPDLVVEVLSRSNTSREMRRKLREYFAAGVRLVWMVDLEQRTVTVHTDIDACAAFDQEACLDGGAVLPGFVLPLRDLFSELDRQRSGPPSGSIT
jgi:Uma2 family endonuclease